MNKPFKISRMLPNESIMTSIRVALLEAYRNELAPAHILLGPVKMEEMHVLMESAFGDDYDRNSTEEYLTAEGYRIYPTQLPGITIESLETQHEHTRIPHSDAG